MKKIFVSAIILLVALTSVMAQVNVKGKGKVITKDRSTSEYERIYVKGSFDVVLVSGEEGDLSIKGESNVIDHIKTEVIDGTLTISTKKGTNLYTKQAIVITVPIQHIEAVSLSGSGDIISKTTIKEDEFEVSLLGSGDITLDVEATRLLSSISGSGDIDLKGSTNYLRTSIKGSGDFEANDLSSNITEVSITGSGDVSVNAQEFISAYISGSGDVVYSGNPEREKIEVSGSGDVTKR